LKNHKISYTTFETYFTPCTRRYKRYKWRRRHVGHARHWHLKVKATTEVLLMQQVEEFPMLFSSNSFPSGQNRRKSSL